MVEDRNGILGKTPCGIGRLGRLVALSCPSMIKDNNMIVFGKIIANTRPACGIAGLPAHQQERLTLSYFFIVQASSIGSGCIWHQENPPLLRILLRIFVLYHACMR